MPPWSSTGSDTGAAFPVSDADCQRLDRIVDLHALQRDNPDRYPFLLQSVARGDKGARQARYDLLFAFPGISISHYPEQNEDFFAVLDSLDRPGVAPAGWPELPFTGGWFVYLGYEMAAQVEPGLKLPMPPPALPLARATRIPAALINDHDNGCCWMLAMEDAAQRLTQMRADLQQATAAGAPASPGFGPLQEDPEQDYLRQVQRIRDYIRDGDVFQVNLSRRWSMTTRAPAAQTAHWLYDRLCRHNPAPFAAHVILDGYHIISSSPERLLRRRGDWIDTRPIAGTRPRDTEAQRDLALSRELLAHPKERAEHIMLIDLERNDLGRVCVPGTVSVDELMVLESYAHVHHIVSNVRGRLRAGIGAGAALRAVFPGGTITGCPKVRCMEIIAELEQTPRGAYTGSLGYLSDDGHMDFNILIRTLELHGDQLWFRTGAGIVSDSQPERELAETRAKAEGLLRALGVDA